MKGKYSSYLNLKYFFFSEKCKKLKLKYIKIVNYAKSDLFVIVNCNDQSAVTYKSEHTILTNLDSAWWFLIPVPLGVVVVLVADFVLSDPLQGVGPAQGDHALHNGHVVEGHLDVLPIPVCLGSPAP